MKKLLLVAVILGVGGYFAYAKVLRPPSKRACAKMHDLCSDKRSEDDDKSCSDFFDTLEKSGAESRDKTAQCVLEANRAPRRSAAPPAAPSSSAPASPKTFSRECRNR